MRGSMEPGHCVQGSWGAWVRGQRYSPCPPSCPNSWHSLLVDPEALVVLEGQEACGDPGVVGSDSDHILCPNMQSL